MRLKGMFTVETSMVLITSLFVIFSTFYLSIFMYDVMVLKAGCDTIVLAASKEDKDEAWMGEEMDVLRKAVILSRLNDIEIDGGKTKKISAKLSFPIPVYAAIYFKNREHVISASAKIESGAEFVRVTEAIKDGF